VGDRYAGGGISFPNRLLGSWSILCRKPETHVPDAPPDSLGRAVRDRGLPLPVLGRDAALSLPQAPILHLRNRYRDYHARGVRRSSHLPRRLPLLEPVRVENAVIAAKRRERINRPQQIFFALFSLPPPNNSRLLGLLLTNQFDCGFPAVNLGSTSLNRASAAAKSSMRVGLLR
jgi:hypothetical protein